MKILMRSYFLIVLSMVFFICACTGGGNVVKVTNVEEGSYSGLKEEDLAKLDEIKSVGGTNGVDDNLRTVIEKTEHFSVSQYLMKHSDLRSVAGGDYTVGGFDVLSVVVYEEKDLSREAVQVSGEGYLSLPLIGRIKVDNLSTSQISELVSNKLAEGQYLLDAHVSVMVTEYNSKRFLVLGAVKRPGSYSLRAQERVLDAISKAGGILLSGGEHSDRLGAGMKGKIIRKENPDTPDERKIIIDIDLQGLLQGRDQISNIYMEDKDVFYVPSAERFYIIGQVKSPGAYTLSNREITLVEAIGMAGGFTQIAARKKSRIIRVENGVEKIINVNVDAITDAGKKIQDVIIQPNDIIVVPESFF